MHSKSSTLRTSQAPARVRLPAAEDADAAKAPIGWSKSMAYQNMRFIDVTLDVFHAPMSSLKSVEK